MGQKKHGWRKPAIIMPATRLLQSLVGRGKISQDKIDRSEALLAKVRGKIDLQPFADEHMEEIAKFLEVLKGGCTDPKTTQEISRSIMNFKSNIGMFSDGIYVELARVMLRWIESVETIDGDVLDVLNGYNVTLDQIFTGRLKSDVQISAIIEEMRGACERYFDKHPELELTVEISNQNAFYVDETELDRYSVSDELDKELSDEKLIGDD